MDLGLTGAAYAYALCKLANAGLLIGWMVWERYQGAGAAEEDAAAAPVGGGAAAPGAAPLAAAAAAAAPGEQRGSEAPSSADGALAAAAAAGGVLGLAAVAPGISLAEVVDLRGCWEYVKYGLPSALMTMLEWWAYELNVILAGARRAHQPSRNATRRAKLGGRARVYSFITPQHTAAGTLPNAEVAVAVLGICLAISGWVYMFPQSIATAATARVSNALGAGDARLARAYFRSALLMVVVQQAALAAAVLSCSTHIVQFFCQDPELLGIAMGIVPIVACNILCERKQRTGLSGPRPGPAPPARAWTNPPFLCQGARLQRWMLVLWCGWRAAPCRAADGMNVVLNGVLRACGRQALGACLQLCSYWLVGVPLSWLLGVKAQLGIAGFLAAVGCTSFTQAVVCGTIISRWARARRGGAGAGRAGRAAVWRTSA